MAAALAVMAAGFAGLWSGSAAAQVACPTATSTALTGDEAAATCIISGVAPNNGFTANFSPSNCTPSGQAVWTEFDNGTSENPTFLSCPEIGCSVSGSDTIQINPGTSSPFTATFNVNGDTTPITVTGTYSRSDDGILCTVSNAVVTGGNFNLPPPPLFSKAFEPDQIVAGGTSTLVFTIDSSGSTLDATDLNFTDTLPAGMTVASPANASTTCSGGTLTAATGTDEIAYSGGTVPASSSCTLQADVTSSFVGQNQNVSGDLTSSLGNSGTAAATLNVVAPVLPLFSKAFGPDQIVAGGTSTLVFTIDNSGSTLDATDLNFTDTLPAGMTVASPANASTTCSGGTLTAATGTDEIAYSGGTVPASSSCTLQADVTSSFVGQNQNVSGDLTSSLGNSGTAAATLNVVAPATGFITIEKQTIGGDDNFDFLISGITLDGASFQLANGESESFELVTGTYLIEEKNLPAGWTLQNIDCGGVGERDGNKITVELGNEETIRCTFTNFKEKDERMEDVVKLFINRRVNNLLDHDPDRTRIIRRLDQQSSAANGPVGYAGGEAGAGLNGPTGSIASTLPGIGSNASQFGKPRSDGAFAGIAGSDLLEQDITPNSSHLGHGFAGAGTGSSSGGYASGAPPFGLAGDFASGQPNGKFSLSLSQIRQSAHARDARKIAEAKTYGQGLGVNGNPYGVAYEAIGTALTPNRLDIWAEGHYSHYDDSTAGIDRDGDFGILYVGSDYALNDWLLLGALVQFDWTDEDVRQNDLTGGVDGWGWMIGPYVGAKLSDNIYFSGRAAWGQSENDISLTDDAAGFRKGSFDTDRWLATAELTGNWHHGPWRFTPSAQIAYGNEDQEAFRNSLGQRIGSNDATVGRLTWGPEIAYRHVMHDGTIVEPLVSLEGIWNFDDGGLRLSDGTPIGDDDVTGKIEGGLLVQMPSGVSWRAVGDYYGIGDGDFDAYGGQVWLSIPLN